MSLQTPEKIRNFQKKLYLKAKAEPDYRFYLLYDKVWRADILEHAYRAGTRQWRCCGGGRGDVRGNRVYRAAGVVVWNREDVA